MESFVHLMPGNTVVITDIYSVSAREIMIGTEKGLNLLTQFH